MFLAPRTLRLVMVAATLILSGVRGPAGARASGPEGPAKARPACRHCGATCGLVAVCICTPGTRKTQKTEYETTCDPVCVPCCSGPPWPWGGHHRAVGCTACESECHDAWVRQRKKLVKETRDEEQPSVERKVAWVCRGCGAGGAVGCTGGADGESRRAGWWPAWLPGH